MSTRLRFTKAQRLKTPSDFRRVYSNKQWGVSSHHSFNLIAYDDGTKDKARASKLGITVSKKVSKLAVVRNRIKRQVKEFYRLRQHQLLEVELVITARPSCAKASDHERYKSLEELWRKLMKWQRWSLRQKQKNQDLDHHSADAKE